MVVLQPLLFPLPLFVLLLLLLAGGGEGDSGAGCDGLSFSTIIPILIIAAIWGYVAGMILRLSSTTYHSFCSIPLQLLFKVVRQQQQQEQQQLR